MDAIHIHTMRPVDLHAVAQATRSALLGALNSPHGDSDLGCSSSQTAAGVRTECITELDSYWNIFRPLVAVRGRLLPDAEDEYGRVNCIVISPQEADNSEWNLSTICVAHTYEAIATAMGDYAVLVDDQGDVCDG